MSVLYPYSIQPFRTLPSKMEVAPPEAISREYNIADCTYSKNTAGSVIVILAACSVSLSDQKPEMRMEINATVEHYPTACSLKNLEEYIFSSKSAALVTYAPVILYRSNEVETIVPASPCFPFVTMERAITAHGKI